MCKAIDIVNETNSTCVPNLLKGKDVSCDFVNDHHTPEVETIDENILLLNNFMGNITINKEVKNIRGTYLIIIVNDTVLVNGDTYSSKSIKTSRALPAILQPEIVRGKTHEHLSLELLKYIHINNTREIKLLKDDRLIDKLISFVGVTPSYVNYWKFNNNHYSQEISTR